MIRGIFVLAVLLASPVAAQQIAVDSGAIAGATADGVASFKGIPYAAAPVGALRWNAPAPVQPWSAPRDTTSYGPDCLNTSTY